VVEKSRGWSLQSLFMPRMGNRNRSTDQRAVSTDGTRTLYVLKDGKPEAVKVRTGSADGEKTEIVSGLNEGDQVIVGTKERRS
jgi:HlyD family secretion protein